MRLFDKCDELFRHRVIAYLLHHPLKLLLKTRCVTFSDMVNVPRKLTNQRFWSVILKYQFRYSLAGLFLGFVCVMAGSSYLFAASQVLQTGLATCV